MVKMITLMLSGEWNEADAVSNPGGMLARLKMAGVRNPGVLVALSRLGLIDDAGEVLDASNPLWTPFFCLLACDAGDSVAKAEAVRRASDVSERFPNHWLDVVAGLASTVQGGELVGRLVRSACPSMSLAAVDSLRSAVAFQVGFPVVAGWWKSSQPVSSEKTVTTVCVTTASDSNKTHLAKSGLKQAAKPKQAKTTAKTHPKSVKAEKSVTKRARKSVTTA